MEICMCGVQAGYVHKCECPYPLYRGTEHQEREWICQRNSIKAKLEVNNPNGITRATFVTLEAAKEWREKHGGRIFVSDDGFSPEWFSLDWLPTDILMSALGSGRII